MKIPRDSRVSSLLDGSHAKRVAGFLAQPNAFDPTLVRAALNTAIQEASKEDSHVQGVLKADTEPPQPEEVSGV